MAKKPSFEEPKKENRYGEILSHIFRSHYEKGTSSFDFDRSEIEDGARLLKMVLPKNVGDLIYSFRFRTSMPEEIESTAPAGSEWVIELAGRGKYRMAIRKVNRIRPAEDHFEIKIPDATPEIVSAHSLNDEQALLAKVRYNRLVDIFMRVTAYSLQNHLRTSVPEMGQIEVDEIYVAVRNTGEQFVIPVQAKGGNDQIGAVQIQQDLALCRKAFPHLTARPIAVQFKRDEKGEVIVMFELLLLDGEIKVVDEKHYRLVGAREISAADLKVMKELAT